MLNKIYVQYSQIDVKEQSLFDLYVGTWEHKSFDVAGNSSLETHPLPLRNNLERTLGWLLLLRTCMVQYTCVYTCVYFRCMVSEHTETQLLAM